MPEGATTTCCLHLHEQRTSPERQVILMKAACIVAPRCTETREIPMPQPQLDEVLVKIRGCGICSSSIPVWEGRPWFSYPLKPGAPGHEGWGEIVESRVSHQELRPGTQVALLTQNCFSEYVAAKYTECYPIPNSLSHLPFPGEAFACAFNIWDRSAVRPQDTLAIVGMGFIGLVLVKLAAMRGIRCIALSRSSESLRHAERLGATSTIRYGDRLSAASEVSDLTEGALCNCVIEAAGFQSTLDLAGDLVCEGGRLVIAGYHQDGPRQIPLQTWNWKALQIVNAHERDPRVYLKGINNALSAILEESLQISDFITHTFFPDQVDAAFSTLVQRPTGFIKGVVLYDSY